MRRAGVQASPTVPLLVLLDPSRSSVPPDRAVSPPPEVPLSYAIEINDYKFVLFG